MLKNQILQLLEENRGKDLSGQQLAERFGVSRSAVWKAIASLKESGYPIEALPNRGYRLRTDSDLLSPEGVSAFLTRKLRVLTLPTVDSTNTEGKRQIAAGLTEPMLIIAESQTAGKGRLGRSFYSPELTGLYMSLVLHPGAAADDWLPITCAAAVAVCQAVEALSGFAPTIKWVNDVYLGDRKLCGILTEGITDMENGQMKSVVIGIGVNIAGDFPEELRSRAISLYPKERPPFSRAALAAAISDRLCDLADGLPKKSWLPEYRRRSYLDGKWVNYFENNVSHTARVIGIDEDGGLVVENESGVRRTLSTGEVTVRPI